MLPPLTVGDPRVFVAATVAIFANYPLRVLRGAVDPVHGIPSRTDRPTLKLIKEVCEEYAEPIRRREQYEQRARDRQCLFPPPVDRSTRPTLAQIEHDLGRKVACEPDKFVPRPSDDLPISAPAVGLRDDGKHALRVKADLEARRVRAEQKP